MILSNDFLSKNINNEKLKSRNEKYYDISSYNFNDKSYEDFAKRVMKKINKEKQRDINDVKIIKK